MLYVCMFYLSQRFSTSRIWITLSCKTNEKIWLAVVNCVSTSQVRISRTKVWTERKLYSMKMKIFIVLENNITLTLMFTILTGNNAVKIIWSTIFVPFSKKKDLLFRVYVFESFFFFLKKSHYLPYVHLKPWICHLWGKNISGHMSV